MKVYLLLCVCLLAVALAVPRPQEEDQEVVPAGPPEEEQEVPRPPEEEEQEEEQEEPEPAAVSSRPKLAELQVLPLQSDQNNITGGQAEKVPRPLPEKEGSGEAPRPLQQGDQEEGSGEEELVAGSQWDYPLGLLPPDEEDREDEESVAFFQDLAELVGAPKSYSAVSLGLVSPVKDQGTSCGACAAFASTSAVETCYRKMTGRTVSFSEQQYIDCAYGYDLAKGCDGSPIHAYLKWSMTKRLSGGAQYPYRGKRTKCPARTAVLDQAAAVTSVYYTYQGSEELLKTLVSQNSAVVVGVWFNQKSFVAFKNYRSGVFNGCTTGGRLVGGHAMVVVGYGTEKGQDYWLIKNSWGTKWGEKGYIKLRRGIKACDVGTSVAAVSCARIGSRSVLACKGEGCKEGEEGGDDDGDDDDDNGDDSR